MPLPAPVERTELHERSLVFRGYQRADGLFDVEGHLVDRKTQPFTAAQGATTPAGAAVHEMWLRLTIDDTYFIHDAVASTGAAPYGSCGQAPPAVACLRGLRIGAGWQREVKERLGGARSCTHITEMLGPLASAAIQALIVPRRTQPEALGSDGAPLLLDSCWSLRRGSEAALRRWPLHQITPTA